MLTKRQKQTLDFISGYLKRKDYSPSLEEIRKHFKLASLATVHEHIEALRSKGYLLKEENQPRSIKLSKAPKRGLVLVPFVGTISAGQPIEPIQNMEPLAVPRNMLSKSGEHFALKVKGDSMIDERISSGDTVIVRKQPTAENGDTIVALINGREATLKKIYKENNGFRLQPANSALKPIFTKDLEVQGKVVSVLRNLSLPPEIINKEEPSKTIPSSPKKFMFDRIICGDVLDELRKIPDNCIHLAITSPPYNVGKEYDSHVDKMKYTDYLNWLEKVWIETKRVLVPGGRFALNIAPTGIKDFVPIHHDFTNQMRRIGMKFRTEIIWYKQTMLKRTAWGSFKSPANPHIVPSWEYVLIFSKDKDRLDGYDKMADVTKEEFMKFSDGFWQIWPETKRNGHPAPFPEELIYRLIKFYSYKGNNVLDMFGGTGTVAYVAKKSGRHFLHIDISPQYCRITRERLNKLGCPLFEW